MLVLLKLQALMLLRARTQALLPLIMRSQALLLWVAGLWALPLLQVALADWAGVGTAG